MKKRTFKLLICVVFVFVVVPIKVFAHPGRLDSKGCHYCRTNCKSWGLETDEYHCHSGNTYTNSKGDVYDKKGTKVSSGSSSNNSTSIDKYVYGCTDKNAKNYNSKANKNDNSCEYYVYGCIDEEAKNYNSQADKDDGSCEYYKYGCTDNNATNYNAFAEKDDGSCEYKNKDESSDYNDSSEEESSGIGSLVTLGGIGAAIYFKKKKK